MRVSDLIEALRGASPDAEAFACFKVPDGLGDYLLFSESTVSFAEPCPGDEGEFLVHSAMTLGELATQSMGPSLLRELARSLEREADPMENDGRRHETWEDSSQ